MKNFLERLMPKRLRKRPEIEDDELRELLSRVTDHDPCLKAVHELLGKLLELNHGIAGTASLDDRVRLSAAERAAIATWLMNDLENRRQDAIEWRKHKDQQAAGR